MSSLMAVFLFLWRSPGPLWISGFLCNSSEPWPSSLTSWDSVFRVGVPSFFTEGTERVAWREAPRHGGGSVEPAA